MSKLWKWGSYLKELGWDSNRINFLQLFTEQPKPSDNKGTKQLELGTLDSTLNHGVNEIECFAPPSRWQVGSSLGIKFKQSLGARNISRCSTHWVFVGVYHEEAEEQSKQRIQVSQWDWHWDSNETGISLRWQRAQCWGPWKHPPIAHMVIQHKHYGKIQHVARLYSYCINTVEDWAGPSQCSRSLAAVSAPFMATFVIYSWVSE